MEKRKLVEARQLISKKEYVRASKLLETMLHDDTALKWYSQVQTIIATQKPPKKERRKLKMFMVTIAVIVTLFGALRLYSEYNMNQFYATYEDESRATLSVFCSLFTNERDDVCDKWSKEIIAADRKNGWNVSYCDRIYGAFDESESFYHCLQRDDIYLPD